MRSMTGVYGPILGLLGGLLLRYPGGTEYSITLRTVSRCSPNTRDASLMLMPSTMQACERADTTPPGTSLAPSMGSWYGPMEGGERSSFQAPSADV